MAVWAAAERQDGTSGERLYEFSTSTVPAIQSAPQTRMFGGATSPVRARLVASKRVMRIGHLEWAAATALQWTTIRVVDLVIAIG